MKLLKGLFRVFTFIILLLLSVNFIRYVISGSDNLLTFNSFMNIITSFDFNFNKFFESFDILLNELSSALDFISRFGTSAWTGNTILEKILSVFTAFYDGFVGLVNFVTLLFKSFSIFATVIWDFFTAIMSLFRAFFGTGWTVT